jgi:hypothetical protein
MTLPNLFGRVFYKENYNALIMKDKDKDEDKSEIVLYQSNKDKGEIILYQPDNSLKLEVIVEDETVWLTQAQSF